MASDRPKGSTSEVGRLDLERGVWFWHRPQHPLGLVVEGQTVRLKRHVRRALIYWTRGVMELSHTTVFSSATPTATLTQDHHYFW